MNEYDLVSRRFAKLAAASYLHWLLPDFARNLHFRRWLDARHVPFPGNPDRTGDVLAELEQLHSPAPLWALTNEFQTRPDPDMFGRLLVYLGTFWLATRPDDLPGSRYQLAAAVVNLTGTRVSMPASRTMLLPAPEMGGLVLTVRERWLQDEPAKPLLDAVRTGRYSRWLLVLVPLHQTDDPTEVVRQWLELFHTEPDERLRSEWCGLVQVLSELSPHSELWQTALEGLNVTRSPFLESIRAEGRKEGRAEDRAEALMQLLEARFPGQAPVGLLQRIQHHRDLEQLRQWFTTALTASTLDEFLQRTSLTP